MSLKNEQLSFDSEQRENKRVTVLGMEFENDDARREYFREELRKKLPELRSQEGFPIGKDEDIIFLSDPPFYTACPNPWFREINQDLSLKQTGTGKEASEPYSFDVSEGKNEPIYNVHTYHTKVPPRAIMRYLLHYTNPGDLVLDGFSGTGMTGVAGNYSSMVEKVSDLGYHVDSNGRYTDPITGEQNEIGQRYVFLNDLSPEASLIANSFTAPLDVEDFIKEAEDILSDLEDELGNYFKREVDGKYQTINYWVWSDVFSCPNCQNEMVFYDVASDESGKIQKEFVCPNCGAQLTKKKLNRVFQTYFNKENGKEVTESKKKMVLLNLGSKKEKKTIRATLEDYEELDRLIDTDIDEWLPTDIIPEGDEIPRVKRIGITNVNQFFFKRELIFLSKFYKRIEASKYSIAMKMFFSSQLMNISKLNRYRPEVSFPYNTMNGTMYIGSLISEANPFIAYRNKLKKFRQAFVISKRNTFISCSSSTNIDLDNNSIDYIFTDPPFGANLMYSELSFLWEAWLRVRTNNQEEAIINRNQKKNLFEYQYLIEKVFQEYYRILKPGRWITVEFSNSKSSVWNAIQEAMQKAGFIIANVSALDKKQGSFKAVTTTIAVKQDLVISAYKPTNENLDRILSRRNSVESAWEFVSLHLTKLPIFIGDRGDATVIPERTPRILFDRMIAYHVQNGIPVPVSSPEFQRSISTKYPMRDGMAFLDSQVAEYDKKRILAKEFAQLSLFVSDENSAIEWIRQQLMKKPQSRQDIHPQFMKEIQHIAKYEELPELDELLAQNFLYYDGDGAVPNQISTYLTKNYHDLRGLEKDDALLREKAKNRWYVPNPNQQADLEKLREKNLLREFGHYLDEMNNSKKKLKVFRTEAIRVGFKKAWTEKEYQTIVTVGERLPEKVIQEDDKLLMYYDNALMRTEM
ncbi:DNA methylase [Listeria monocytogenes]|nr:DNA methylase [Listeria monocytogenes]